MILKLVWPSLHLHAVLTHDNLIEWGLKERELGNCKRSLEDLNTQLAHLNEEHITSQRQSQERDAENTSLKSRLRDQVRYPTFSESCRHTNSCEGSRTTATSHGV